MKSENIFIIAELSANHNNDFELAVKTINAMAKAGADAVKIQTYTADSLTLDVDNEYFGPRKEGLWKGLRPYELFQEASMPYEWQPKLKTIANDLGMEFFSSPFDFEGVDFLEKEVGVQRYKIASMEINDIPLIRYTASKGKPIIISTGVADEQDIQLAINTCYEAGNKDVTILKCTSDYPASISDANLLTIPDMISRFGVKVGVSDHTMGSIVPIVAASLGACVVEKHFILDRSLGGPDSAFSMEPAEFKSMVQDVRHAEASFGKVLYVVTEKDKARRRSLFITKDIKAGEKFTKDNVKSIRPGIGLNPSLFSNVEGRIASYDLKKGTPLSMNHLKDL